MVVEDVQSVLAVTRCCAVRLRVLVGELALLDASELDSEVGNLFEIDATLRDTRALVREMLWQVPN